MTPAGSRSSVTGPITVWARIEEELAYLATRPAGTGERYPSVVPTALRLESLRLSDWLSPESRALIDTAGIVLDGAARNDSLALYGESHLRKAIDWAIAHAEPRTQPTDWGKQSPGEMIESINDEVEITRSGIVNG